jgi:hypothetical protein
MSFRRAWNFHVSPAEMIAVDCFISHEQPCEKGRSKERGVAERWAFPPFSESQIHHFHCRRFLKSLCQPANNARVAAPVARTARCFAFLMRNGSLHGAMVQHGVGPNR